MVKTYFLRVDERSSLFLESMNVVQENSSANSGSNLPFEV